MRHFPERSWTVVAFSCFTVVKSRETQTAAVWLCFPFIRCGQKHLARHSERGKKTRQTMEEVGRQHQGMDRPRVRQVPEGSGEQGKMEKTDCKIICGAPTTLAVKGLVMMMMTSDCKIAHIIKSLHFIITLTFFPYLNSLAEVYHFETNLIKSGQKQPITIHVTWTKFDEI